MKTKDYIQVLYVVAGVAITLLTIHLAGAKIF